MAKLEEVRLKTRLVLSYNDQILLLKQHSSKGGKYSLIGGKVERQELMKHTLIRETEEEVGIRINPQNLHLIQVLHILKGDKNTITFCFMSTQWTGQLRILEPHKFQEMCWCSYAQLPDPLTSSTQQILNAIQQNLLFTEYER